MFIYLYIYMFAKKSPNGWNSDTSYSYRIPSLQDSWYQKFYKRVRFWLSTDVSSHDLRTKILYIIWAFVVLYSIWVVFAIYMQLPTITPEWISNSNFSQSTELTDKNGKVLYNFYEENRKYIWYEKVADQAVNAFIAIEDSSFWTNEGIDVKWIVRAVLSTVQSSLGFWGRSGWASTITQQLLKNILWLNKNESWWYDKVVRKHKERLLVGKLSSVIESDVKQKFPTLSSEEIDRKKKEKIMELYLNYIYLGNQNYGIEAAAQWYFNKSAQELSIVEWAILASMPQAPTHYNPYKYPTRVLWTLHIRDAQGQDIVSGSIADSVVAQVVSIIMNNADTIDKWNGQFQQYIESIIPKSLTFNGLIYQLSYDGWRKDAVLNRIYEDWYITQDQLKRAFADGLVLKLKSPIVQIKAPHFVFWIRDLLLNGDPRFKDLGVTEEMLNEWGIKIKTTLDLDIQEVAEKSIKDNMPILYDRWGNNRSLLHIDTTNGDVLAYVWSADYNNVQIQWQNDMVRNARQPWSSVKPLVYAYALQSMPLTIDTPIYDIPLTVWSFTPNNADGKFEWLLPLREALAHSRNIPAVKAYFAAGKEPEIKPFLQSLGLKSLRNNNSYGYSLALWAGEVPMLEMAQAYSFLSQKWEWFDINPILEIKWPDGQILYTKEPKKIVSSLKAWPAYLIWKILSDTANMPAGWIKYYAINGLKYAVKSWTSNKVIKVNGEDKSVPRDWWLATYTPSRVTMYRAGNADDKPMNKNALWLLLNSEVNKSFYAQMLSKWYIQNQDMSPVDVDSLSISKVTGKIATDQTPKEFVIKTLAFNAGVWTDTNPYTLIPIDLSCGWKASPLTPMDQKINGYLFTPTSITSIDLEDINKRYDGQLRWLVATWAVNVSDKILLVTKEPKEYCEWRNLDISDSISLTTSLQNGQTVPLRFSFSFSAQSTTNPIKKILIMSNNFVIGSYTYDALIINDTKSIKMRNIVGTGEQDLQIVALTENNVAQVIHIPVVIGGTDGAFFATPSTTTGSSLSTGQIE